MKFPLTQMFSIFGEENPSLNEIHSASDHVPSTELARVLRAVAGAIEEISVVSVVAVRFVVPTWQFQRFFALCVDILKIKLDNTF